MNKFIDAIQRETNIDFTENGAKVYRTSDSDVLNFFSKSGAMRNTDENEIIKVFKHAIMENPKLATKALFYARDVRGGLGERRLFRVCLKTLAKELDGEQRDFMEKIISLVPVYGRWDDLFVLADTEYEDLMWDFCDYVLFNDYLNALNNNRESVSLCAKWMPSCNAHNREKRKLAARFIQYSDIFSKAKYMQARTQLLKYLDVVEVKMCTNDWDAIKLDKVPSKAFTLYTGAFYRHVPNKMEELIKDVKSGKKTINAGAIYPYDIFHKMGLTYSRTSFYFNHYDEALELQWKNLPNYVKEGNVMIMADTSGSMSGTPIEVALSLAVYYAERNTGPYHNKFMTFSERPSFVNLHDGDNLNEKIKDVPSIMQNTDLEAGLKLILDVAVKNNLEQEDLPKALVVISDMQFDEATWTCNNDRIKDYYFDNIQAMYRNSGYEVPNIIFWNVDARENMESIVRFNKTNVQMVSGYSPSVFKYVNNMIGLTPYEAMLKVLSDERYNVIDALFEK